MCHLLMKLEILDKPKLAMWTIFCPQQTTLHVMQMQPVTVQLYKTINHIKITNKSKGVHFSS